MDKKKHYNIEEIKKAISLFGSMNKLAIAINANNMSVFNWTHGKAVPSPLSCMKIEKATKGKIKKEDIRPDFDWENFELI